MPVVPGALTPNNEIQVASMLDVAATMLATIQQRAQARDYEDLAAIVGAGISFGRGPGSCRCRIREGVQCGSQPESTYVLRRWRPTQPQSREADEASGSGRSCELESNSAHASKNRRDPTERGSEMNHPELRTVAQGA